MVTHAFNQGGTGKGTSVKSRPARTPQTMSQKTMKQKVLVRRIAPTSGEVHVAAVSLGASQRRRCQCGERPPRLSDILQVVPAEGQENGQREEEEEKEPEAEPPAPPQVSVEVALPPPVEHEVKKGG